jgi:hypothetical protein
VSHYLKGVDYPAKRDDLMQQAKKNGAESEVLNVIKQLPDQEYGNMADVMKGYGEVDK